MNIRRYAPLVLIVVIIGGFVIFKDLFDIPHLKRYITQLHRWTARSPLMVGGGILGLQAAGMLACLPTKAVLNLLAAALLGFWTGSTITLLGVLLGTSGLFFVTRTTVSPSLSTRTNGTWFDAWEKRLQQRPITTVAALRLVVSLPYGPITIATALSGIRYRHFILGSIGGDLPVIMLYSLAGTQIHTLTSTHSALSPFSTAILIIAGLVLLASTLRRPG